MTLNAAVMPLGVMMIGGREYWVCGADAGPWRLSMAEPTLRSGIMLGWLLRDLSGHVLLAFPLVLLPLWVTVWLGIRPLRELARALEKRDGADLSPLAVDLRYGELQPLATGFDAMLLRLRRHVRRERALVQDAAHELRTPMAAIVAQAHVLARAPDAEQRQAAEAALEQAVARTSHLSRQLLELSTFDEPGQRERQAVDLAALVQQALAQQMPQAFARDIDLSLEAPDSLVCEVDRFAFLSVLGNLVDNALRYGFEGGRVVVTLRTRAGMPDGLLLCVADDGPGIAPALRERAFERFWRGAGHDASGSGLGLAIVQAAVAQMGGSVCIEAGVGGRGVAFRVEIPAAG